VRPDGQLAQRLDVLEETGVTGLAQHPTEELAEQADVVAQRFGNLVTGQAPGR